MKLRDLFLLIGIFFVLTEIQTFASNEAPADSPQANAFPAEKVEPDHARAVIQYNARSYARAAEILSVLLSRYPKYIPALELKAICLRQMGQNDRALEVYNELVETAQTPEQKVPYYFEVGSVHFNKKDYIEAKKYFSLALKGSFNWGATHYFLGLIAHQQEHFEEADFHFNAATWSKAETLKSMAYFYMGLVFAKENHTPGLLWAFSYAKNSMKADLNSPDPKTKETAQSVTKASDEILKNFDRDLFLGSLFLSTQYDSNIAVLPDVIASQQATGKSTTKAIMSATLGFNSSPVRWWQLAAFYKNYYNYNFSSLVKGYSFFSNMPSLTATIWPQKRFSWGLMGDVNYTFNDRFESGHTIFRPFSVVGTVGPFAKFEYIPRLPVTIRYGYKPKKYYLDPTDTPSLARTGTGHYLRASGTWNSLRFYLNPTVYGSWEYDNTNGNEFRDNITSFGVSNEIKLTKKDSVSTSFDFVHQNFPDRLPFGREDNSYSVRTLYNHIINKHISAVVDVNYIHNSSNVTATYEYSRFMASVGANLSL